MLLIRLRLKCTENGGHKLQVFVEKDEVQLLHPSLDERFLTAEVLQRFVLGVEHREIEVDQSIRTILFRQDVLITTSLVQIDHAKVVQNEIQADLRRCHRQVAVAVLQFGEDDVTGLAADQQRDFFQAESDSKR